MEYYNEYNFKEIDDYGLVGESIFSDAYKDMERAGGLEFGGGGLTSTTFEGDSKMAKLAKKLSKLNRNDQEIFADKAVRAINILNTNCNFNITKNDINTLITRCQIIQDKTFKSTLGIILATKYETSDNDQKQRILKCANSLRISLLDIIKYKRLLKKYKIIK